jgi:hypothetical protein
MLRQTGIRVDETRGELVTCASTLACADLTKDIHAVKRSIPDSIGCAHYKAAIHE